MILRLLLPSVVLSGAGVLLGVLDTPVPPLSRSFAGADLRLVAGITRPTMTTQLPPKKASWPFHYHLNNEEAVYILEGTGVMCVPEGDFPVKKGDYIHFRAGKEFAHRLVNPSEETTLRYLCFSTLNRPDVAVYPSTGKLGIFDFQHGLGMRFHGLNDSGLPYYQPTGAAGSAYLAQAHRSPTTRAFDMECEKPQEEEQPAAQE